MAMREPATELTPQDNDLVQRFLEAQARARTTLQEISLGYAQAYKACIDRGIDMRPFVKFNRSTHDRLLLIAAGQLIPLAEPELLWLEGSKVKALAPLPREDSARCLVTAWQSIARTGCRRYRSTSSLSPR
jgi:hypothetical protein